MGILAGSELYEEAIKYGASITHLAAATKTTVAFGQLTKDVYMVYPGWIGLSTVGGSKCCFLETGTQDKITKTFKEKSDGNQKQTDGDGGKKKYKIRRSKSNTKVKKKVKSETYFEEKDVSESDSKEDISVYPIMRSHKLNFSLVKRLQQITNIYNDFCVPFSMQK